MGEQLDPWRDAREPLGADELYLERAEKLLFRRLYEYIICENWPGVGKVTEALVALKLI